MAELVTQRCSTCGFRSAHAESFRLEPGKGGGRAIRVCFGCAPQRLNAGEEKLLVRRWASLAIWTIIAVKYGLEHHRMDGVAVFCAVLLAAQPLTTILHEAAHAAIATLVGFRASSVRIGRGPERAFFRIGETDWSLRRHLSLGGVTNFTLTPGASRLRRLAVYAAGAAVNLGLGVTLFSLAMAIDAHWNGFFWLVAALVALAVSNLTSAFNALWPTRSATGPDSDGAQILDLLRGRAASATSDPVLDFMIVALRLTQTGRFAEAADAAETKLKDWPNDPYLLSMLIHSVARAQGDAAALARYHAIVAVAPAGPPRPTEWHGLMTGSLAANIAWSTIKAGGDLAVAAEAMETAQALLPDSHEMLGTLGALKVMQGEAAEGERLLLDAMRALSSSVDRADFCTYVAKARRALGDETAAVEAERLRAHILARGGDPVPV